MVNKYKKEARSAAMKQYQLLPKTKSQSRPRLGLGNNRKEFERYDSERLK